MDFIKRIFGFETSRTPDSDNPRKQAPQEPVDPYIDSLPEGDKYFGFENESATMCYANSSLQILFHCHVFRDYVLNARTNKTSLNMLNELQELFRQMVTSKKAGGRFEHKKFIQAIKKSNAVFDNDDHHDSHEFMGWLLDSIHEETIKQGEQSFVQELFGGKLQNEITCLQCESHKTRSETFYNLSLDIEKNTSLNYCIKRFNFKELLNKKEKFYCEQCLTKQVATKTICIQSCPKILLVHLKRFKFDESTFQHQKLTYRIPYPSELRLESLENTVTYTLRGIVVHAGSGMAFGHYYAFIRSCGKWIKCNDNSVSVVEDNELQIYFGSPPLQDKYQGSNQWPCAYLLLYEQTVDEK